MDADMSSMKQTATKRREAIKKIISKQAVEDQEQLVALLAHDFSIKSNQAVVSRDLMQLGIVKRLIGGKLQYDVVKTDTEHELLRLAVKEVVYNEAMIVVHTVPGMAAYVGDYLDVHAGDHIIGTLAGENVLLIVPSSIKKIETIYDEVRKLLKVKK